MRIAEWRKIRGLSQAELSNKSGIDSNMISRYERNTAVPTLETISRLALGLEVTVDELLNGPSNQDWELRLITTKTTKEEKSMVGTIDLTGKTVNSSLEMSDSGMGLTLSASYDLWADDAKFENLLEQIRHKRAVGLKIRREEW